MKQLVDKPFSEFDGLPGPGTPSVLAVINPGPYQVGRTPWGSLVGIAVR